METSDVDTSPDQIVYQLTQLPGGTGSVRLSGSTLVQGGTFTQDDVNNNRVTFRFSDDASTTSFRFTITDGTTTTSEATFAINGIPVNDEQVLATNTGAIVAEGSSGNTLTSLMLQTLDVDNTPGQLVYTVTASPGNGTLRLSGAALRAGDMFSQADINAGNVTYDHDGSETISDSFDFSVDDGQGTASNATFKLTVTPVNDSPTAITPIGFAVDENIDTTLGLSLGKLSATDADLSETFNFSIRGGADAAKFSIGGADRNELILTDGTLDFETKPNYTTLVRVTDSGLNTFDQLITVTVNDVNEAPTVSLVNQMSTIAENTPLPSSTKVADIVVADDALGTSTIRLTGADAGKFTIVGGSELHIMANTPLDFERQSALDVTVEVDDPTQGGGMGDAASLTLAVMDVNESPVASGDRFVAAANTLLVSAPGILGNDMDPEGDAVTVTVIIPPIHGSVTVNADGSFTYTPDQGFVGTDQYVYQIDDGLTAPSTATVRVDVQLLPAALLPQLPTDATTANGNEGDRNPDALSEEPAATTIPRVEVIASSDAPVDVGRRTPVPTTAAAEERAVEWVTVEAQANRLELSEQGLSLVGSRIDVSAASTTTATTVDVAGSRTMVASFPTSFVATAFIDVLNELRDEVGHEELFQQAVIGSTVVVSSSLSVGYVLWLVRGGVLLSSMLSSLPAWQFIDPLPVLGFADDDDDETHDDSLEEMVEKSNSAEESQGETAVDLS